MSRSSRWTASELPSSGDLDPHPTNDALPIPTPSIGKSRFARDMQTHHRQAVEMAFIIRDKTTNSTIRTIAYDIITTQQQQAGQMYGWLAQWRLHQTGSEPPMAWMGSGHHMGSPASTGSTMPGMATPAQLAQLRAATGPAADRLFLTLMIAHHRGGIGMARAIQPMTENPAVDTLAGAIETSQEAEITQMTRLRGTLPT
ncbi:DUF305 domain-containing protein [Calidifontibacter indicus]|uniref:Uncharacterized protein (DUF305 family) n=1 Tax=Calidifontibacter indicus TaxID=419650 RepID=A0A3D9U9N9_9MICO|nr:DUF305 domain-containing protein [Calidifontibacter indicus]REF24660.1 uncharacterized protein (DUF305 family) [Calidifontibacter indicus]